MAADWMAAFLDAHRGGYRPAGICLSCRHGSGCAGGRHKNTCRNYVSKELTKEEWKHHYADLLRKMVLPHVGVDGPMSYGKAHNCRNAMLQIHGFSEKDCRAIEDSIEELQTAEGTCLKKKLRWEL